MLIEKPLAANLNEAERILLDYLFMLSKQNPLLATQGNLKP